mmetsp:Transcript_3719/g.5645  ORF Transcript_3719/g.5645 Transcript_3719/m.5645 type:complete len:136 (+) Transcript_3719:1367-1774(+)
MIMIISLYIISKAGGLIYQQDFAAVPKLSGNDYLRLASTFDSFLAISAQISPVPGSSGIEVLEADTFKLQCLAAPTGVKFFVTADPSQQNIDSVLRNIYELYADYVLKNPFYELDMPIRCELFDLNLEKVATSSS